MADRHEERAIEIVREHLSWHRHGRPRPIGGFPPEFFADELTANIAAALREVERDTTERIAKLVEGGDPAMANYIRRQVSNG